MGSLSCSCSACVDVRGTFLKVLKGLSPFAPPLPSEVPPLPPSTFPPRFNAGRAQQSAPAIPETIAEDSTVTFDVPIAPFRANDLPLVSNPRGESSVIAESDAASEAVTHISIDRCSYAASVLDSEWSLPVDTRARTEWIADSSNLKFPPPPMDTLHIMANTDVFDIASQRSAQSSSSWIVTN